MTLKKIYNYRFFPLVIYALYFLFFGVVVYFVDFIDKEETKDILKKWVPWNLKINFFLILIGLVFCGRDIIEALKSLRARSGIILGIVCVIGFLAVCFVAPRTHRIFYDEHIYANMGQNIAFANETGHCHYGVFEYDEYRPQWIEYNKQPNGWPFLISIAFEVFGANEMCLFILNNLLFCGSLLIVFFITWYLTGEYFGALLAAIFFGLIPHNLVWSNTGACEPSASFFAGLTALILVVYLRSGKNLYLYLLALILPFACQMRSESILILFWVILAFLLFKPQVLVDRRLWAFGLVTTIFLVPHLVHAYAVSGHSWGAEGAKFSLEFFQNNLSVNGSYYFNNQAFPVLFTVFAVTGFFLKGMSFRWRLMILLWFLLFWGVFLLFYAGSYRYGADVRYALVSFMPISILAGAGAGVFRGLLVKRTSQAIAVGLIVILVASSLVGFLPLVKRVGQTAWGARYDHLYAREFIKKIPERSVIVTHNPSMFFLWDRSAVQAYMAISNLNIIRHLMARYQGHVYFHYDYWCNTSGASSRRLCQAIMDKYRLTEVAKAHEQHFEYGLYKMSFE